MTYLFCLQVLKFYPIRLSFIFLCLSKFQSRWAPKCSNEHHPQRPKHATFKMSCLPVETLYPLEKTVKHLGDSLAPISVSGTKKSKENVSRVARCSCCCPREMSQTMYVAGAEGLVSQLHCFRLAKGFWVGVYVAIYVGSVCSEGICRSWKNEFDSEIAELEPWRHFSCIHLYSLTQKQWSLESNEKSLVFLLSISLKFCMQIPMTTINTYIK